MGKEKEEGKQGEGGGGVEGEQRTRENTEEEEKLKVVEGEVVAGDKVEVRGQRTKRHEENRG